MNKSKEYRPPLAIEPYESLKELLEYQLEEKLKKYKDKYINLEVSIQMQIDTGTNYKFWLGLQESYDETVKRINGGSR